MIKEGKPKFNKTVLGRVKGENWYTFFVRWNGWSIEDGYNLNPTNELRHFMVDRFLCGLNGGDGKWIDGKLWVKVDHLVDDILSLFKNEEVDIGEVTEIYEIIAAFVNLGWMEGRGKREKRWSKGYVRCSKKEIMRAARLAWGSK